MNLHHAPTHIPSSHERHPEANTRLHGCWLLFARILWLALVVFTLSVCIASLPDYFTELQTVCRLAACSYGQLSPDTVVALQHFGLAVGSYTTFMFALNIVIALVFFGVGCLIFWRKSDDWMALLFALGLVMGGMTFVIATVASSHSAWQLPIQFVGELLFLSFFLVFILFPNGRFVPRWTRWLLVVMTILSVIFLKVFVFFTNPFTAPLWIAVPLVLLFFSLYAGLVIAQIYRYRYVSNLLQRQQTKWVVYGLTVNIVVFVAGFWPTLFFPRSLYPLVQNTVFICTMLLYPFTIGISILRYRLWDIDVLINRTLVYATLTASLTLVYVGSIIVLQYLLRGLTQGYDVAIVGSTLVIAALFQPLRRRIQQTIDRRFYRRKYDAARTLATFSATLRSEVDLNQLYEQLVAVVEETMQPTFVSLWLRPPEHDGKHQASWRANLSVPPK